MRRRTGPDLGVVGEEAAEVHQLRVVAVGGPAFAEFADVETV